MRNLFFLIAFLPFTLSSQTKRIGVVCYWSGHQNSYSFLYHLPYGIFSSADSTILNNKFFYGKKVKDGIKSEYSFYNVGIRLDQNVFSEKYFLKTELNYFHYSKKFEGTIQYSPYFLQAQNGNTILNSLELSNTFCRTLSIKQYFSLNIGFGFSFWTSFNGKAVNQFFYPNPSNSNSTNNDYFYLYNYYPQSSFINSHLLLEAKFNATEKLIFLFSIYNGYNYYWANTYDISIMEVYKYDPSAGYVQTGGGWAHNKIKQKGSFPDIIKPSFTIMWKLK